VESESYGFEDGIAHVEGFVESHFAFGGMDVHIHE
jgi:hypothetical protein